MNTYTRKEVTDPAELREKARAARDLAREIERGAQYTDSAQAREADMQMARRYRDMAAELDIIACELERKATS